MKKCPAHSQPEAVTQPKRAYTPGELALIDQLAQRTVRKKEIVALFPDRTVAAVKQQINAARHRLGLIQPKAAPMRRSDSAGYTMLEPDAEAVYDDWHIANRRAQTAANGPFLAALAAMQAA
jgi:hypothetical protein